MLSASTHTVRASTHAVCADCKLSWQFCVAAIITKCLLLPLRGCEGSGCGEDLVWWWLVWLWLLVIAWALANFVRSGDSE